MESEVLREIVSLQSNEMDASEEETVSLSP